MAKGTTSDYAALHVQGAVRVRDLVPAYHAAGRGCWDRPLARRLENIVLAHATPRGRLGFLSWPLALLYRMFPEMPLRLLDAVQRWGPPRLADAWRTHVARVLAGRMSPVPRAERALSHPKMAHTATEPAGEPTKVLRVRNAQGQPLPPEDRFMGLAGTLWNQPRSVTLEAANDPADGAPCVMLLIKRKALEEIVKKGQAFYEDRMHDFIETVLPAILPRNRLFQDRLGSGDVRDWSKLLAMLAGRVAEFARIPSDADGILANSATALRRVRELLDRGLMRWLPHASAEHLDAADREHIIERLNEVLARQDLAAGGAWGDMPLNDEARAMLQSPEALNDAERFRLHRLLLEAAMPGVLEPSPRPAPLTRDEFRDFTVALAAAHREKFGKVLRPERLEVVRDKKSGTKKGVVVFKQGDPADAVVFILGGMVRVSMDLPGGRTMVNNMGADTCIGESAILDDAAPWPTQPASAGAARTQAASAGAAPTQAASATASATPVRSASVETLCDTTLLRLNREILQRSAPAPIALADKLRRARQQLSVRDEQMRTGRLVPPSEPPLAIAERLMLTRNLLLIDMGKCTRCDQCVRRLAEAHDLQPRFHRANPELRFGRWEVAGACLHCLDAPCQQACPVGAITLLEDSAVQIHRDRCIGCSQCAHECPFGVIDMYAPTSPADAPSSKKGIVANKCDLCLTQDADPPCVACCPYDAARRVAPVEFFPELHTWAGFTTRRDES